MLPKWLQKLIAPRIHQQSSSGPGCMQIGKVEGAVTNVHLTQHIYGPRKNDMHQRAQSQPLRQQLTRSTHANVTPREVLARMDKLPDRIAVLDFMEREFQTRMVIDLEPAQLYRLKRYVEVVLSAAKR